jgi:hypothetical protein
MINQNILENDRFKNIAELVLGDETVETNPTKSVIAQPTTQEEIKALEWQLPGWFEPLCRYCEELLDKHPDYRKNVFVMMKFEKNNKQLDAIYSTIKETLHLYNLNALRADERHYTNQLWDNVRTYMLCCQYGIAVLENIAADELNPNVALEYGFMSALNRSTMLLVENRFRNMRADITGTIVYYFDGYNIKETVQEAIQDWLKAGLGFPDPGN